MSGLWKRTVAGANELGASESVAVTNPLRVTPNGAKDAFRVDLVCSSVTVGSGITAKVQHDVGGTMVDVTGLSVAVTGNGTFSILMNGRDTTAGYFASLPLGNKLQVVVTTTAGSAVTLDNVYVTMED